ncbi:holin [Virgibacillus salexigens]|nr:holin [Virgibacillus massiliensis]
MNTVLIFATVLAPILAAVMEAIKKTVKLPNNFIPLISLGLGIVLGLAAYPFTDLDLTLRAWAGGFAGLAGTGLFELVKKREGSTK